MRILVTEDHADMRQAIARELRARGHSVDEAASGEETADFLLTHEYAVIVLDRMLPDGDAVNRLESLRARGLSTPVLLLTARDRVEDRVDGLQAGADDYLVKPFAMEELLARVAALGRRSRETRGSVLQVGGFEIDLGRREVRRDGTLIPLRPKEFAVLELLGSRIGQVVTRQELFESCWDEAYEPNSNVEEVVIAALRRKLDEPRLIRTVRGAGYRLETSGEDA